LAKEPNAFSIVSLGSGSFGLLLKRKNWPQDTDRYVLVTAAHVSNELYISIGTSNRDFTAKAYVFENDHQDFAVFHLEKFEKFVNSANHIDSIFSKHNYYSDKIPIEGYIEEIAIFDLSNTVSINEFYEKYINSFLVVFFCGQHNKSWVILIAFLVNTKKT
jgi:hypothetical protein